MKKIVHLIQYHSKILLTVIFLLAFFSRVYKLGQIPISLYWDETAMLVDAKTLAQTGKDMHGHSGLQAMFPSYGDYKLPVYIWLASVVVKIFGATAISLRLVSVILSLLQIVFFLILGKAFAKRFQLEDFETKLLLISIGFICTVTPWMFHFSRVGFEGFIGQFFVLISVLCLFLTKNKPWLWLVVALTGVLGVYSYYSVRFVWPILVVVFTLINLDFLNWKQLTKQLKTRLIFPGITLFIWFLCLLPLLTSPFYKPSQTFRLSTPSILNSEQFILQSNQLREQAGNGILSRVIYHRDILRFKALLEQYAQHFNPNFIFVTGDPNLRHGSGNFGILLFAMAPCLFMGIIWLWRKDRRLFILLITWWMIGVLPASVPLSSPHALRSLNSLAPLILLSSIGLFKILLLFFSRKITNWQWWISISLPIFLLINASFFFHDYFIHYPVRSAQEWQAGYHELAEFIYFHRNEVRTVWVNTSDDRFYLWILGFSSISPTEIQQLPFQNYQLKEIGNIRFQPFDWDSLESLDHKMIVIEKPGKLKEEPREIIFIKDALGTVRFEAGIYGQ